MDMPSLPFDRIAQETDGVLGLGGCCNQALEDLIDAVNARSGARIKTHLFARNDPETIGFAGISGNIMTATRKIQ